jgi:hypothetical protein
MASEEPRLTITLDRDIYESLLDSTTRRKPRLTKRYVVELALARLFEELQQEKLKLGFNLNQRKQ